MDYFTKKRLAIWGVVLLVIMNLASLATVWYQQHHPPEFLRQPGPRLQDPAQQINQVNAFLRHELQLSDTQAQQFADMQRQHFNRVKAEHDAIRNLRQELFNQLSSSPPDTVKVEKLATAIGDRHRELEILTFQHLIDLKKLCTAKQQQKLNSLFRELLRVMEPRGPLPPDERSGLPPPRNR